MDLVRFVQLIGLFCELIKLVAGTVVSQLHRIEQKLGSLIESKVSNNNEIHARLNSLERLVSNGNDTQLRQEIKIQELHDLVSKSFGKFNQEELEQKEESLIEEKTLEVMSINQKMQELQDQVSKSVENPNQQLTEANCDQELEQKEERLIEETQDMMSTDSKMQELQDLASKSVEKSNQQLTEANCDQELEQKEDNAKEEMAEKVMPVDKKIMSNDGVELLNEMPSISQLLDKYLFGSEKEQKMFESLCHKWTIKSRNQGIELWKFYLSDNFFIQEYNFEAQLRLILLPYGIVNFGFSFKDKEKERKKMESENPPLVTMILKDCSRRRNKKHVFNYEHYFVTDANPFYSSDNWMQITRDKLEKLISPTTKSMKVLFLVKPATTFGEPYSTDGTLTDIIPYFAEKFQMEHMLHHGHWSPHFLTHPNGYRLLVKINLERYSDKSQNELVASIYFFPDGVLPHDIDVTFGITHPTKISKKNLITQKRLTSAGENKINIGKIHQIENGGLISLNAIDYYVKIEIVK